MKKIIFIFLALIPITSFSSEVGRYQIIKFDKTGEFDGDRVMILDTKDGHLWTWSEYSTIKGVREGGRFLIYQGKATPGKKMGDVIHRHP